MIIRQARPADGPAIAGLCAAALWLEPDGADLPALLGRAPAALVAEDQDGRLAGAGYGSIRDGGGGARTGHVDLLAVAPGRQESGHGAALLAALESRLAQLGATEFRLGGNAPVYAWPGIDPRYTAMTCLAGRAGYARAAEAVDMVADLTAISLDTSAAEARLAAAGISVRRAGDAEGPAIARWLEAGPWGTSSWPAEAAAAIAGERASCHVASAAGGYLGFACQGVNRRGWFGPMGTLPESQRTGIGTVLLTRCLADMKAAGLAAAQISWAGPVRYYGRAVGARIGRVYWLYRKPAGQQDGPGH